MRGLVFPRTPRMDSNRPNFFAGPYLERRAEAREDPEWVAAAWADSATSYVVARGTAHLLHGAPPRAALLTRADPLVRSAPGAPRLVPGRALRADQPAARARRSTAGHALRGAAAALGTAARRRGGAARLRARAVGVAGAHA